MFFGFQLLFQVKTVLDFYSSQPDIDIEFVDWSALPKQNESDNDPNLLLYRTEVYMAVFDCLHRSRYSAEFVAQLDLDETIVVGGNENLTTLLDRLSYQHGDMASVSIVSRRAQFLNYTWNDLRDLHNFDFNPFHKISAENYYFPRPAYSKLIHKPERVVHGHHHSLTKAEVIPNLEKKQGKKVRRYRVVEPLKSSVYIMHLR